MPDMQTAAMNPGQPQLRVRFYQQAVLNTHKTEEEGRPVHDSVVFIEKLVPGSEGPFIREKWQEDERKFPSEWRAYLEQQEVPRSGTRLEDWGQLAVEQIADLKGIHVFTIEELAVLTDGQLDALGLGGRDLRTKAKAYLDGAKDKNYSSKLAGQVEELRRELEEAKRIMKEQGAELKELREAPAKRK